MRHGGIGKTRLANSGVCIESGPGNGSRSKNVAMLPEGFNARAYQLAKSQAWRTRARGKSIMRSLSTDGSVLMFD